MSDTIFLNDVPLCPPVEQSSIPGYIKHVHCDGVRFHVLSWSTLGKKCSEKSCVVNTKNRTTEQVTQ